MFSTYHYSIDMHPRVQANLHQNHNRRLWRTPESKNGRSNGFLMLCGVIGNFITSFSWRDTATYVRVGNRQTTSRVPKRWSTSFTKRTRRSRGGNERQQLSFWSRKQRKWVEFRDSGAEERHQLDDLFCFSLLHFFSSWSGPVQMALAWVLPPLDHSQVEVEFPRAPDPQHIVRIGLSCFLPCMKICSPGGLRIERGIM